MDATAPTKASQPTSPPPGSTLMLCLGPVNGLTWNETGSSLITLGHDGKLRVWDLATGEHSPVCCPLTLHPLGSSSRPIDEFRYSSSPQPQPALSKPGFDDFAPVKSAISLCPFRDRGCGPSHPRGQRRFETGCHSTQDKRLGMPTTSGRAVLRIVRWRNQQAGATACHRKCGPCRRRGGLSIKSG